MIALSWNMVVSWTSLYTLVLNLASAEICCKLLILLSILAAMWIQEAVCTIHPLQGALP